MDRIRWLASVAATLTVVGAVSCSDPATPCFCTEEFRFYTVTVVDRRGAPVSDVQITRTLVRTGEPLEPGWLGLVDTGVYVIADDGTLDLFSSAGDTVRVRGVREAGSFVADFVFAVPDPCRCHVIQLAGPERVVIGE